MKRNGCLFLRRLKLNRPLSVLFVFLLALPHAQLRAEQAEEPAFDGYSIEIGDAPYFNGLTTLLLTTDGQQEALEGWPDKTLVWKDEIVFLEQKGEETERLGVLPMSNAAWWPSVSYADIDFDGKPDFFLLDQEAMTGSRYRLVSSNGAFPAARFKAPPSQIADDDLLFKDGISPEPAFFPETGFLEFIDRDGPFYTTERWRWNGSSYALVERRNAIYSPEIDNAPMAFMERMAFDEQGRQKGETTYHPTRTKDFAPLRIRAFLPIPLYLSPSFKAASTGSLKPGAAFDVIFYDKNNKDGDDDLPLLWLKAKDAADGRIGWVAIDLITMTATDNSTLVSKDLYNPLMDDYMKRPADIIAVTEVADGIDLSVKRGGEPPFVIPLGEPVAIPYKRQP